MNYLTLPYHPVEEEERYGNAMRAKAKAVMSRRCMVIGAAGKQSIPAPKYRLGKVI